MRSASKVAAIRAEHAITVSPMVAGVADAARLKRELSNLVNRAYGLTPEDRAADMGTRPTAHARRARRPTIDRDGPCAGLCDGRRSGRRHPLDTPLTPY
jgi:hypothetical protein